MDHSLYVAQIHALTSSLCAQEFTLFFFFKVDFWPQMGLCCILKAAVLLSSRSGEPVPEGLESLYTEQWLHMTRQPLVRLALCVKLQLLLHSLLTMSL